MANTVTLYNWGTCTKTAVCFFDASAATPDPLEIVPVAAGTPVVQQDIIEVTAVYAYMAEGVVTAASMWLFALQDRTGTPQVLVNFSIGGSPGVSQQAEILFVDPKRMNGLTIENTAVSVPGDAYVTIEYRHLFEGVAAAGPLP